MSGRLKYLATNNPANLIVITGDVSCGIGPFKPKWLQRFADPKIYTFIFCMMSLLQSAYFFYFIGIMSTLEKRFGFKSLSSGLVLIGDIIIPVLFGLSSFRHIGTKSHKSRIIASGMLLVVLSCLLSAFPFFVYGPRLDFIKKAENLYSPKTEVCELEPKNMKCGGKSSTNAVVWLFFLANFLNGFGHVAFYFVGIPYVNKITNKKNSFASFSAMASLRIFGPVLGFLLSSFCLKFYEDPFYDPGIDPLNPRWVGAWWMGFLILGVILLFFTFLLALFPRQLPERFRSEKNDKKEEKEENKPKMKDFPQEMRRLLKNPILVCHVISVTFQVNGFAGYFVFMPKFMEAQYLQSASDASLFSGTTGILSMLIGILLGGFIIMKYKPRPRYLTGYMVIVEIVSVLGLFASIFLGCDPIRMPGTTFKQDETLNLYNGCNSGCSCTRRVFEPVCAEDGLSTYFSPCFAGCPNLTGIVESTVNRTLFSFANPETNATIYESCKCASGFNETFVTSSTIAGYCPTGCKMFLAYIILLCISKFISSTARVGNTLITFRCVDSKDKSFALGTFGSVLAMFAFIPYPLIYGALTDSACLVWEETCSKTGNCWLYDSDKFRYYLHGMSILLISIGICFDIVVFFLSDRLSNFYGEDDEKSKGTEKIAKWLKEDDDEDIIFTKYPTKRHSLVEVDPVL